MCVRKISAQCVLQFTPSLAAGCVLHRPVSRVIHCSELYSDFKFRIGISPSPDAFELITRVYSPFHRRAPRKSFTEIPAATTPLKGDRVLETPRPGHRVEGTIEAEELLQDPLFEPSPATSQSRDPLSPRSRRGSGTSCVPDDARFLRSSQFSSFGLRTERRGFFLSVPSTPLQESDGNDPSAGSPTKTLLRLLLPLNDQVWSSFRHAGATRRPLRVPVRRPH
jgi:hypothetical protein